MLIASGRAWTVPSGWKSKQVRPPYAAMYWSCLPTGSPSRSISISQASSRHFARMQQPLAMLVERAEQRGGEAAGRAEAGAGGDVGHAW